MSAYPVLAPKRVDMPLDLRGWAVFAGRGRATKSPGLLFEGKPGVADHVWLWSTGDEVHVQPHYTFSTWDEFWADPGARMHATGFGGLFPFTLGDRETLVPLAPHEKLLRHSEGQTVFVAAPGQCTGAGLKIERGIRQETGPDRACITNASLLAQCLKVTVVVQRVVDCPGKGKRLLLRVHGCDHKEQGN